MILPSGQPRITQQAMAELPRWHRLLVRGRFLLAGVYFAGVALLAWAIFFNYRLFDLQPDRNFTAIAVVSSVFFAMQALLLSGAPHFRWPRPRRRRWMAVSLAAGALMAGLLTFGFVATLTSLSNHTIKWINAFGPDWAVWLTVIGVPWLFWLAVFTLLWSGPWLGKFRRMYRLLLAGTWLEMLITVPVDVAVRKRTQCYCDEGTFFSLMIGITMIFWTFGPGVVLLFFSVRGRHEHPAGICARCGYDLRGLTEPRCPECGTPFEKADAQEPETGKSP
jgi:hypothetical protein